MAGTIPHKAKLLLGFIYETETSRRPPECYDVVYGHNQTKLPKRLTSMTLDEVTKAQAGWSKQFGSSAAGAPQLMRKTLIGLISELGLRGSEKLDAAMQDRLGYALLKRRGFDAFLAGSIDSVEFAKRLAQEWASFPVLRATQGAHRKLSRGQSYYAGDGLNKALVKPEQVEALLARIKAGPVIVDTFAEQPVSTPKSPANRSLQAAAALLVAGVAAVFYSVSDWISETFNSIWSLF